MNGFDLDGKNIKVELSKRGKPREKTPGKYLGKNKQKSRQF